MPGNPGHGAEGGEAVRLVHAQVQRGHRASSTWAGRTSTATRRCSSSSRAAARTASGRALGMLDPRHPRAGGHLLHPRVARGIVAAQRRPLPGEAAPLDPRAHGAAGDLRLLLRRQRLGGDSPAGEPSGWLDINGLRVPFVTMNNEPESTDPAVLEARYAAALGRLWALRSGGGDDAAPDRPFTFEHLFVLGRPAGGKSEFIDFMKKLPADERAARFGIGRFEEVDDFPWLWEACVDDDAREARGEPRLVSERTPEGYNITRPKFRGSLVDRFNEAIAAKYLAQPRVLRRRHAAHRVRPRAWTTASARAWSGSAPTSSTRGGHPLHQRVVRGVVPPQRRALQAGAGGVDPLPQGARPRHARVLPRQRLGRHHRRRARRLAGPRAASACRSSP